MSDHREHCHEQCPVHSVGSNVSQSLDELEFERGIWSAAQSGDLDKVISLLDKGVDVNATDGGGYTALHYAARNGRFDVCKYLLEKKADVNATTKAGMATPLHRACSAGLSEIVKVLLEHDANVELQDNDGKTALHRAAEVQSISICERILAISPYLKSVRDAKDKVPADYATDDSLAALLKH